MATKKSEFDKVLSAWDVLVIAFGAMIGWGWVVSTGDWITRGGVLGAMLGFVIGGIMVFFVGLTYAELTSAMPQCGGEHVFSFKAMGPLGSFVCTWAIVLGYVSVVCFEACAMPTIITYIYPDFLQGYMYSVAGFEIYASWLITAIVVAILITYINIRGAKTAAILQTVLTVIIGGVGILLIAASAVTGDMANLDGQLFMGATTDEMLKGTIAVAVMTPFYFIGFDVIPQAAEEITVSLKKIGRILILSIVLAVAFYALIIGGVGYVMNSSEVALAMKGVGGLVTADAMSIAFGSSAMAKVLIIGGLCGIVTSWNSFMIGGSRAMYSMAESYMIPRFFGVLHKKYKTPINALILIGLLSVIAPFFGRKMLVWVVDAGNFGCCLAYCMVSISFMILRKKAPAMARPYKVNHYKFVGTMAVLMSGFMVIMYMVPGSPAALVPQEWAMVLIWSILGVIFGVYCKTKYGANFATHVDVAEEGAEEADRDAAFGLAMESAMHDVKATGPVAYAVRPVNFSFTVDTPLVFGSGKSRTIGDIAKPFGTKALLVADTAAYTGSGLFKDITDSFSKSGMKYSVFAHAMGPIRSVLTANGADMAKQDGCDIIVAVGGNDVIDCAKSIAYAMDEENASGTAVSLIFVPTTFDCPAATSPAFSLLAKDGKVKRISHSALTAKTIIADPDCMKGMSRRNIAQAGFTALCQNISAHMAPAAQPLVDVMAMYGISLLHHHLAEACEDTARQNVWEAVVLGGMIASMAVHVTSDPMMEAVLHAAADRKEAAPERFLSVLAPRILAVMYKNDIFKFGKLARTLGGFTADDCASRLRAVTEALHLDCTASDLGVSDADLTHITATCLEYLQPDSSTSNSMEGAVITAPMAEA